MTVTEPSGSDLVADEPGANAPDGRDGRRGRLHVEARRAARIVAPAWPLERFVAVNPLQGLQSEGFDAATAEARRWLGTTTHPGADVARRAVAAGRLDRARLAEAMVQVGVDRAGEALPVTAGVAGRAADVAVADLLDGTGPAHPPPLPRTVLERLDARDGTDLAGAVDDEVARWCALLLTSDHLSAEDDDPWEAWRATAVHDRRLARLLGRAAVRDRLARLPRRPEDAIEEALAALGVGGADRAGELRGQLARLPGWAGYARWCDEWATPDDPAPRISLVQLLAMRLVLDALGAARLGGPAPAEHPVAQGDAIAPVTEARVDAALGAVGADAADPATRAQAHAVLDSCTPARSGAAVLQAMEAVLADEILDAVDATPVPSMPSTPAAQVVCCIDVRSEGLRRHLEASGPYDTLGFAGFFAVPMRYRPAGSPEAVALAPALVTPEVGVDEGGGDDVAPLVARRHRRGDTAAGVDDVAHGATSMYAFAEAAGWLLGPMALAASLAPAWRARPGSPEAAPDVSSFSLDERTYLAEAALRTMGLTAGFAPLVVLCGHGATSTANAHAATLDCGACGGNHGGPSARAAAAILNDPAVRRGLADRGIEVPSSTWFVAAEHDTTTDEVTIFDASLVPEPLSDALSSLRHDLAVAGRGNAGDRLALLPGGRPGRRRGARTRAGDWAETRPEWGLTGNAAFIVGPRDLTRDRDLGGRSFLHSYDADADPEGSVLEAILTAPVVVAHWINMAYYGATVAPACWGAGDKTRHNPLPPIGVLEGTAGDLRPGLPWQSVADAEGPRHEPLRLLVVVAAPHERVESIVARNPVLVELFDGAWVHLAAGAPGRWWRRQPGGGWTPRRPVEGGPSCPPD